MAFHFQARLLEKSVFRSLNDNPVTAILGPRQCGKSTLVKHIMGNLEDPLYLDLELPSDLNKLNDPEWFLRTQSHRLVCLDEIQRKPELFPILRGLIDEQRRSGMYLILGSASRDLLQQSSETLAGRISYKSLTPFLWPEIEHLVSLDQYLSTGGFPPSLLATDEQVSFEWRLDFINTFLERDLLQFAGFTPTTMRRLWQMLAHSNGQTVNLSALGNSLGVSHPTIRHYIDLLEGTFMVSQVLPYFGNTKKRLVKSPKVYLSDTGIATALLGLRNYEQAAGHPSFGALWEGLVLANMKGHFPRLDFSFYRTNHGNEVDFLVSDGRQKVAVECKVSIAPSLSAGNYKAIEDIRPDRTLVVSPVSAGYSVAPDIQVVSLSEFIQELKYIFGDTLG